MCDVVRVPSSLDHQCSSSPRSYSDVRCRRNSRSLPLVDDLDVWCCPGPLLAQVTWRLFSDSSVRWRLGWKINWEVRSVVDFCLFPTADILLEDTCTFRTVFATCYSFANSFSASFQIEELTSLIFQSFRISCLVLVERFYWLEVSACFGRNSQLEMSLSDVQFDLRFDTCGRTNSSVFTIYIFSSSFFGFTLPPIVLVAALVK